MRSSKHTVHEFNRCQILHHSSIGRTAKEINHLFGISISTIYRVRKRYRTKGLKATIYGKKKADGLRRLLNDFGDRLLHSTVQKLLVDGKDGLFFFFMKLEFNSFNGK